MSTRRHLLALGVSATLSACAPKAGEADYDGLAASLRARPAPSPDVLDLIRYACLAPNGHNTQAWRFAVAPGRVSLTPDLGRRTPVVDPDDHHLFVSLGCATENLRLAAEASGRQATAVFHPESHGRIDIELQSAKPRPSVLFDAIPRRQTTRSLFTGAEIPSGMFRHLEEAAGIDGVSVMIVSERAKLDAIRDFVVHGNGQQMQDAAFRAELKSWIRFNPETAMARRDGLFSGCTGNPAIPTWMGERFFPMLFNEKSENDTYAKQMASSSAVAVFVGDKADPEHWVKVGRSVQRFVLQATALDLKYAVINQPIEVVSVREAFASWLGTGAARPDFVLRLGYAAPATLSLRRPLRDVVLQT